MTKTIDLIKKHTQEYNEYMLKNGDYSFHRFTDGSIHFTKPLFVTKNIVKETDISPLRPVRELEELVKVTMNDGALVTINDYIRFRGRDVILCETEIAFCNCGITIEYTGINSIHVDYNHDLRKIITDIKNGRFGDTVFINGIETGINDFVLLETDSLYFTGNDESCTLKGYVKYDNITRIADSEKCSIFWRSAKW